MTQCISRLAKHDSTHMRHRARHPSRFLEPDWAWADEMAERKPSSSKWRSNQGLRQMCLMTNIQLLLAIVDELPYLFGRHDFAMFNQYVYWQSHSIQLRFFMETMKITMTPCQSTGVPCARPNGLMVSPVGGFTGSDLWLQENGAGF